MTRHLLNSGAFYAFIAAGLGRVTGVAAALIALGLHVPWVWALGARAIITLLGLLRVDITGKVLGVLLTAEITVIIAETVSGLAQPAGGDLRLHSTGRRARGTRPRNCC